MTLRAFDGFDHYNNGTDLLFRTGGALSWSSGFSIGITAPGRNNYGKALSMASIDDVTGIFDSSRATWFFGCGAFGSLNFSAQDSGTGSTHVTIFLNGGNGRVTALDHTGAVLGASANNVYNASAFQFVECLVTVDASSGVVQVNIEGTTVLSLSGINTKNPSGPSTWDSVSVSGNLGGGVFEIDDFYYADTTTGPNPSFPFNTFIGDCRVQTLFAVGTGAGGVQWTPLSGANWQEISETAMDSDVTYNHTTTPTDADFFNFQPLIANPIPVSVQTTGAYRMDSAGTRKINQQIVSVATQENGGTHTLSTGYLYFTDIYPLDPNGGIVWSTVAVDALQAGYTLVT